MKHTSIILTSLTLSVALLVFISCSDLSPVKTVSNDTDNHMNPIASVDIGAEGKVEFFEPEPGCLITEGVYSSQEALAFCKELDPVALYEYFSGETAPDALKEAHKRSQSSVKGSSQNAVSVNDDINGDINGEVIPVLKKTNMSASDFIAQFCNDVTDFDFSVCLTNRTGNNAYIRTCTYWKYIVNPYRGNVVFKYLRWNGSSYEVIRQRQVLEGKWYSYAVASQSPVKRKFELNEANDDGYHYCHKGNW